MKGKSISYYDPEKYRTTGNGCRVKYFSPKKYKTPEEMAQAIDEFRSSHSSLRRERRMEAIRRDARIGEVLSMVPSVESDIDLDLDRHTGNTIAIIASSKSGKTIMMARIFKKYFALEQFISMLFTKNPHIFRDKIFKKIFKNSFNKLIVSSDFGPEQIKMIKTQKLLNIRTDNQYAFLNIFDDLINIRYSDLLNDMVLTYRNANISTILLIQYSNLLSKMSRANYNYLIMGSLNTDEAIVVILKSFLSSALARFGLKSLDEKINFYKLHTRNHQFIVFNPRTQDLKFVRLNIKS